MDIYLEYYNKIHDKPLLFALVVAVALPFVIITVGFLINLFGEALGTMVGMILAPVVAMALINYVFFPGVMIHELSHAFMALITGAKITEVALFKKQDESLGHVNFRNRGNFVVRSLQDIFISSAPMFGGAGVITACIYGLKHISKELWWLKILIGYIAVSMFFHMTMSPADIKVYVRGIPVFMVLVFIITAILRFTGVV